MRPPDELAKATPSFNKLPLMFKHTPVSAEKHRRDLTVGTTGDRAVFKDPWMFNTLAVWDRLDGIEGIEDNTARALSCGYAYEPDMTPGVWQGVRYDGVMRNIRGNHVILTKVGRAGPDIVVGDSMPPSLAKDRTMATQLSPVALKARRAAVIALTPMMAMDAAADITPAFVGLQRLDQKSVARVTANVTHILSGKIKPQLAMDDVSAGLRALLEALGGGGAPGAAPAEDAPLNTELGAMPTSMRDQDVPPDGVEGAGLPGAAAPANDAPPSPDAGGAAPAMPPADTSGQGAAPQNPNDAQGAGPIEQVRSFLQTVLNPDQMQHLELLISQVDKGQGGEPDPTAQASAGAPGGAGGPPAPAPKAPAPPGAPPAPGGPPAAPKPPAAGGAAPPAAAKPAGAFPPKKAAGDAGGPPSFPGMPKVGGGKDLAMAGDSITRADLEAALKANDARHKLLEETRAYVRGICGSGTFLAMDSAEEIVKGGLRAKGFPEADLKQISELPALKAMLGLQAQASVNRAARPAPEMALDAAGGDASPYSLEKLFGKQTADNINRIKVDMRGAKTA